MKRSFIFSSATVAGLTGVLMFHTAPVSLSLGSLTSGAVATTSGSTAAPTTSTPVAAPATIAAPPPRSRHDRHGVTQSSPTSVATTSPPTTAATTATTVPSTVSSTGVRTATGALVNYFFGTLSVSVTAQSSKITKITIGTLSDGGNYRSMSIDQMAIPVLEQEAMAAQSANIQSVSGASYTSAGFAQSLQSALTQLGI